jgi:N-acyl-L-homoserine lactone synthetase
VSVQFVRELRTVEELSASFALRYEIYKQTSGLRTLQSLHHDARVDVDSYDVFSRHLGLFQVDDSGARLVGSIRFTYHDDRPMLPLVRALSQVAPSVLRSLGRSRFSGLPTADYLLHSREVARFTEETECRGERVVEAGRFAIRSAARLEQRRRHGLWLAGRFIEAVVAWVVAEGQADRVLVSCLPEHGCLYRPYGFREIPGVPAAYQPRMGVWRECLVAGPNDIPELVGQRISGLVSEWHNKGMVDLTAAFAASRMVALAS